MSAVVVVEIAEGSMRETVHPHPTGLVARSLSRLLSSLNGTCYLVVATTTRGSARGRLSHLSVVPVEVDEWTGQNTQR